MTVQESIPIPRFIDRLDTCFIRNDMKGARDCIRFWENEARRLGDKRGLLTVLNEAIGYYRRTKKKARACRFTENCSICDNGGGGSKRQEIKTLIRRLNRDNPLIETSIFNSIHSVNVETFPGYKRTGIVHSYLEEYDA